MVDPAIIKKDYDKILQQLTNPELISNWEKFEELSRKKSHYEKIIAKEEELADLQKKIEENKTILAAEEDPELTKLAEEELKMMQEREKELKEELENLLRGGVISVPKISREWSREQKPMNSVIAEIRAGVGGEEAALFAADLFHMYSKYAQLRGWKQRVLDSNPTTLGGYKEIIFELTGEGVFEELQFEGGVHRVQRVPETEKGGRIHTSTCSVAILPKPKKSQIKIRPEDLKIDFYRASGPGGQYVNRRETAVRITHLPSNIVVTSQTERNQLQNKENAMAILEAKLLEKAQMEEEERIHGKRKAQVKWAKRAEKIRTYNFPQDRVTDHRIKKSWHGIEEILNGKLGPIISALSKSALKA